ncbi:MAG: class II aldolase/adducin family protein [Paucibacter sp.]|nr:class II aldolase/adducin family protein [Roseateles sp.]
MKFDVRLEQAQLSDACEVLRRSYERGWISTRDGNVSLRLTAGSFHISPSGARKFALNPEDFVLAERDATGQYQLSASRLGAKPSGEMELHQRLHALMPPDRRAVLHLHPTSTVAAMFVGMRLAAVADGFPEVARYTRVGPDVPPLPATSGVLAEATAAVFSGALPALPDIVGLDRHGVVAIGRDVWDCYEHVERLEHICQIVLHAAAAHGVFAQLRAAGLQVATGSASSEGMQLPDAAVHGRRSRSRHRTSAARQR